MAACSRRDFLKTTGAAGAALSVTAASAAGATKAAPRPNIVVILADDMGFSDLGCYGSEINTPNIDGLAADGVRFTQFYNCAKCSPSRTSLMTGQYHQAVGTLSDIQNPVSSTNLATVLKGAGYNTCMVGKVHGGGQGGPWDRQFRVMAGAFDFFDPAVKVNIDGTTYDPYVAPPDFYTTDAFTDHAIDFVENSDGSPFFLYMAYNAPHYPLHARQEDIDRYADAFNEGYDEVRRARFERQQQLGIADSAWTFSERDSGVPAWDTLASDTQEYQKSLMRAYAAMIDRLDQNVGRLMEALRRTGADQNTVIFVISDNGAVNKDLKTLDYAPGTPESYYSLGTPWSNAANTPFRKYKKTDHEGGITTPCIAWWGNNLANPGTITRRMSHLIDIMPTCVELAGADYPASVTPMQGRSLVSILEGTSQLTHPIMFWQYLNDWRAVRQGHWKALKLGGSTQWCLFDFSTDRAETVDLAARNPDKLDELRGMWDSWKANDYCATGIEWPVGTSRPSTFSPTPSYGFIRRRRDGIDVVITAHGPCQVDVVGFDGRLARRLAGYGPGRFTVPCRGLGAGWYVLRVYCGRELFVEEAYFGDVPAVVSG